MKYLFNTVHFFFLAFSSCICFAQKKNPVNVWLTKGDSTVFFSRQNTLFFNTGNSGKNENVIKVEPSTIYQTIDGFGFALTQGSAMHMIRMNTVKRAALIKELFDTTGNDIGISYLRLSIGASDLNEKIFSYDDLPPGHQLRLAGQRRPSMRIA